jgi:hypothetical protein
MTRVPIIIQAEDRSQRAVKQLLFKGCKPKSSKIGTFENSNGEPVRITMTFIYLCMED